MIFCFLRINWGITVNKIALVVDDSLTARKLVCQYLKDFQIIEASNGLEALTALEEHDNIAIVFMDLNMPWMGGVELLENIKKMPTHQDTPVCVLTTESSHKALAQVKEIGVSSFIVKPANKEQIESVVQALCP